MLIKPEDADAQGETGNGSAGRATYDRFRDRIMFPITDRRGRVIAFGGRALGDIKPKYLNSPDTPLFHKGQVLYNLALAREAARETGQLIVAEGYMDVIALGQAGFGHAVAPLGTALTEEQMELLWKLVPEPILCFDGDGRAPGRGTRGRTLPAAAQTGFFAALCPAAGRRGPGLAGQSPGQGRHAGCAGGGGATGRDALAPRARAWAGGYA